VRQGLDVKVLAQEQELYVLAQSHARIHNMATASRTLRRLMKMLESVLIISNTETVQLID